MRENARYLYKVYVYASKERRTGQDEVESRSTWNEAQGRDRGVTQGPRTGSDGVIDNGRMRNKVRLAPVEDWPITCGCERRLSSHPLHGFERWASCGFEKQISCAQACELVICYTSRALLLIFLIGNDGVSARVGVSGVRWQPIVRPLLLHDPPTV